MNLKKTILLILILCILIVIAYVLKTKPKKTEEEIALFPGFNPEQVENILINGPTNDLSLKKETEKWLIAEKDNLEADTEQVKQALETVSELRRDSIVSTNPDKQEIFQVDPNKGFEVEIKGKGDITLAHFYIGKNGPDYMSTYVRKADSKEVVLFKGFHMRSRFDKNPNAWLNKTITNIDEKDILKVQINKAEKPYSLIHEEEKWFLEIPEKLPVKEDIVNNMISALASLKAVELQRLKQDESLEEFGLVNPYIDIIISLFDGTSQEILVGKLEEKKDNYYVKLSDQDIIYSVGKYNIDKFDKEWIEIKAEEQPAEETPEKTEPDINPNLILTPTIP